MIKRLGASEEPGSHLMAGALGGQGGEADDVAEEDGDAFKVFRLRNLTSFHLTQNLTRQLRRPHLNFFFVVADALGIYKPERFSLPVLYLNHIS
jgi:hypothetical protein